MQITRTELTIPLALSRGRHASPSDGVCLMELASMRAGEAWSDQPACVHPVLATIARIVNDKVADQERARLAPLVDLMIGTAGSDPGSSPRLVLLCADAALARPDVPQHIDLSCQLEAVRRRAVRQLARMRSRRGRQRSYLRTAASHAALAMAALPAADREDRARLCELLESCVATCRTA